MGGSSWSEWNLNKMWNYVLSVYYHTRTYRLTRLYDPVGRSNVYNFIMDDWGETFWIYVKELQHNVNDNIALQAFIKTTTLLNCPDFPSIFNNNTSIWLKMLDIGVHQHIAINIAILWLWVLPWTKYWFILNVYFIQLEYNIPLE